MGQDSKASQQVQRTGFLGSLRDALAAASREDTANLNPKRQSVHASAPEGSAPLPLPLPAPEPLQAVKTEPPARSPSETPPELPRATPAVSGLSAAEAAREARGGTMATDPEKHVETDVPPTTRVVKSLDDLPGGDEPQRTQFVRGKQNVARGEFQLDPVVGWLVVVGGPGIGSFRPIFEGNNTIGRGSNQRIPLDFGDDAISAEEQAYIRYDSTDRSFLFVPNLAKTNIVTLNDKRPTGAVELSQMDVIVMGRTQLVFVPFCGSEFDWAELMEANKG